MSKDTTGASRTWCNRFIRRKAKQLVRAGKDVPHANAMLNQYDFCDTIHDYYQERGSITYTKEKEIKARRK